MMANSQPICCNDGCDKISGQRGAARGMCRSCYRRWQRWGDCLPRRTDTNARPKWIEENKGHQGEGCLIWPFSKREDGRGQYKLDGRSVSASRAMCIAAHGNPPTPEHEAAHSCGNGNGGCVNPKHLRWATPSENAADKWLHGTALHGATNHSAVLTEDDVRKIRSLAGSAKHSDIAKMFGVRQSSVTRIIRRQRWAWLE